MYVPQGIPGEVEVGRFDVDSQNSCMAHRNVCEVSGIVRCGELSQGFMYICAQSGFRGSGGY